MTKEEAIKWLENLKQDIGQLRHENLWPYAQAIDEIIDMLDEQEKRNEPIEPIKPEELWICGACGEGTVGWDDWIIGDTRYNYCPNCGKAVKWK